MSKMDTNEPYGYPVKKEDHLVRYTFRCINCKHRWTKNFIKHQNGWEYRISYSGTIGYHIPKCEVWIRHGIDTLCPACNSNVTRWDQIDGKKNDKVKCDRRCTGATGHNCECSCGGENHGADHLVK